MSSGFRIVPLVVAAALFMENMDGTVISTSLPQIAADLSVDPVVLKLAFTAYLVTLAVFIPLSGWAADRLGSRTVFRLAIVVFMLGSIGCGYANSLFDLVLARAVQGLGGAMMVPVGRLVVLRSVPKNQLVSALAYLTVPALIGPVIGPPLGGFITTYFDWRWIFWINLPIGFLGLVLATLYIPNIRIEARQPFDMTGFLLSGTGLALSIFGLTLIGRDVLPGPAVAAMMVVGALAIALYVRHAGRIAHPILELRLLRLPTFRASVTGGVLFRLGIGATPFLLPLMLQVSFGLSAFESGMLTFVSAAGAIAMKFSARPLLARFGFRTVLIVNGLLAAVSIAASAGFTASTPAVVIMSVLLIGGFFRSLQFSALNALAFSDISHADMSKGTSFSGVVQQLSQSIGVAVAAMVIELSRHLRGETALTQIDFATAFLVIGAIAASSAFLFARLPADAGAEVSGHRRDPSRGADADIDPDLR
ncbi:MAG: DHA2 family efflux MFS transporter permease subunit [Hyphomicrobiaceae bacterium]|nr:DHA2 family efflux MFS transporter permease subunit [Hyphomicrobiaceae bacterium]